MVKNNNMLKKLRKRNQEMAETTLGFRSEFVGRINYRYAIIQIRRKLYIVESSETKNILRYFFFLFPFFPTKWKLMRISEEELAMIRYKPIKSKKKRQRAFTYSFGTIALVISLSRRFQFIASLGRLSPETHLLLLIISFLSLFSLALIVYFRNYPIKGIEFKENARLCLVKDKENQKDRNKLRFILLGYIWLLLPFLILGSFMALTVSYLLITSLVFLPIFIFGTLNPFALPTSSYGQKYKVEELEETLEFHI